MPASSEQVKHAIKSLLKKAGLTYEDLAQALKVSLPTIRRILTKEDIGLERLLTICEWLGITLEELAALANQTSLKFTYLTEAQESYFASQPDVYTYLRYLGRGITPREIEIQFKITSKTTKWYLNELIALDLIDFTSSHKVRLKVSWPTNWRYPGPLEKKFGRAIYQAATDHLLNRAGSETESFEDAKYFLMLDSLLLSEGTYQEYLDEIRALYRKYTAIGRHEMKAIPHDRLKLTSVLFGIDRADFITEGMAHLRDRRN